MMKKCILALLLGAGAAPSLAQEITPLPPGTQIRHLVFNEGDPEAIEVSGGYGSRFATVYDSDAAATCAAYILSSNILDDVSFGPTGPWANTTDNVLRSIQVPVANSGTALISYDVRITIWDSATFTSNPMIAAAATPLFQVTVPINNLANGAYNLTLNLATPPTLPDNQVFLQLQFFSRNTTTQLPITTGNPSRTFGTNLVTTGPGSSTDSWALDTNNNAILEGGPRGTLDHRRTAFTAGACTGQPVNLPLVLTGDIPIQPPTSTNLGVIGDSLVRTDSYTAGQIRWFSFTLPNDISDAQRTFLDIVTLNSTLTNTAMALYESNGNIIWQDDNSGPDDLAQLTFGIGRRSGDGNGEQFDGYDGELQATGTFYLAVAEGGTRFSDAFLVTPVAPGTAGNVNLRFRSNVVSGTLAPSVAPNATDVGQLLAPGVPGTSVLPGLKNILWTRFELCKNIDGATPDNYLDIDFANSDPTGDADQEAFIFNSAGNLVATSDDDGPGLFPQFSFGDTSVARGPYAATGEVFQGASGAIGAGIYYLGVGHFDVRPLDTADTDGRFHIRPLGGDNLNIQSDFYVGFSDCASPCPSCPADFDQSGGVDGADVEAFYTTWESGEACGDTNQDGSVDGSDVEAFFVVWEAGGC